MGEFHVPADPPLDFSLRAKEHWPDVASQLPGGLTSPQIEGTAIGLLSRAFSIGRVVAFVGTGTSMAYGRAGWSTLFRELANDTRTRADGALRDNNLKNSDHVRELLDDFGRILESVGSPEKTVAGPERLPLLFQVSERLREAIENGQTPGNSLRKDLCRRCSEDDGDARSLLKRALLPENPRNRGSEPLRKSILEDLTKDWFEKWDSMSDANEPIDYYKFRGLFSNRILNNIASNIPNNEKAASPLFRKLLEALSEPRSVRRDDASQPAPLYPLHRFAVPAMLLLAQELGRDRIRDLVQPDPADDSVRGSMRADLIPAERDPLLILLDRLHITRFLTTNYDDEIERLFKARDYSSPDLGTRQTDTHRDLFDPLGVRARELVFTPQRASELVDFAIQDPPTTPHVIHLHGKADNPDRLVVTESDYQDLYLRDDEQRPFVDRALRLTFAANPLLFVGLGMEEGDILRPLRQFMSERLKGDERLMVALLPMTSEAAEQGVQQAALLQRYGVYGIYYGKACLDTRAPGAACPCPARQTGTTGGAGETLAYCQQPAKDCPCRHDESWLATIRKVLRILRDLLNSETDPSQEDCRRARGRISKCLGKIITQRIDETTFSPPYAIEGRAISRYPSLNCAFEIGLINAALFGLDTACETTQEHSDLLACRDLLRFVLTEVETSLLSVCLCAFLLRLQAEASQWRESWFAVPEKRDAGIPRKLTEEGESPDIDPPPRKFTGAPFRASGDESDLVLPRQTHYLRKAPENDTEHLRAYRFFRGIPGRPLRILLDSLRDIRNDFWQKYTGRRLFLLIAPRGAGRGHLFDSFLDETITREVVAATWGLEVGEVEKLPAYPGVALLSFSFSIEITSVFDRLIAFLQDRLPHVLPEPPPAGRKPDKLENDRIGRLRFLLRRYHEAARDANGRLLVVINGVHNLFDRDGQPKNAQFHHLFESLVKEEFHSAPIDFIFITSDVAIPGQFRAGLQQPPGATPDPLRLPFQQTRITATEVARPESSEGRRRLARALLDARSVQFRSRAPDAGGSANPFPDFPSDTPGPQPVAVLHVVRRTRGLELAAAYFPRVSLLLAGKACGFGAEKPFPEIIPEKVFALRQEVWDKLKKNQNACVAKFLAEYLKEFAGDGAAKASPDADLIDSKHREVFYTAGGGRYPLTLLLAAADEHLGPVKDGFNWKGTALGGGSGLGDRALDFLERASRTVRGRSGDARGLAILEVVLEQMARQHAEGLPPPITLPSVKRLGPRLLHLMHTILWHLAIVGQPVELCILNEFHEIVAATDDFWKDAGEVTTPVPKEAAKTARQREVVLREALQLLVFRCLVIEVTSVLSNQPRYCVHRLMQRHVFDQMRAAFVVSPDVDRFSLSLFASQPDELPQLSPDAHRRIGAAVSSLVSRNAHDIGNLDADELTSMSQRLRAAYGILRSIYHVGIIAHFDGYREADGIAVPAQGYMEMYRQQIDWLVRKAEGIDARIARLGAAASAVPRPFYAEEIVWLLNESGVLSLMQGRIGAAAATLERADSTARAYLEPLRSGPVRTAIALNWAIAEIERGNAAWAVRKLKIIEAKADECPALRLIAHGYIGLADHLSGSVALAMRRYQTAVDGLQQLKRSRAASIFSRHLADAARFAGGTAGLPTAIRAASDALQMAQQGKHIDMAHLARLSELRIKIASPEAKATDLLRSLDSIRTYARVIGLPRLHCEELAVRARLKVGQGDLHHAIQLAAESLEVATLHDMRLRKVHALNLLAEIQQLRGQHGGCQLLFERSADLAGRYAYHHALEWIQGRLEHFQSGGNRDQLRWPAS